MTIIAVLFILVCIVQLLVIVLFRKPKKLFRKNATKAGVRTMKLVLIIVMIFLYIGLFFALVKYHSPQPLENKPYIFSVSYPTLTPGIVRKLGERQTAMITNLYFLYPGQDKSQAALTTIAFQLRQQYCKKLCIINLYDDKTAFEKDIERVTIASDAAMKEWNKKNYVFVADHYLGYLDVVQDAPFMYYPFHDSYYQKAKSGSLEGY